MTEKGKPISTKWNDPDDAPEWTDDQFSRAEIRRGDEIIRPADGTLTKPGGQA
jgi:hypothetical protein